MNRNYDLEPEEIAEMRALNELSNELEGIEHLASQYYKAGFTDGLNVVRAKLRARSQKLMNTVGGRIGSEAVGGRVDLETGKLVVPMSGPRLVKSKEEAELQEEGESE